MSKIERDPSVRKSRQIPGWLLTASLVTTSALISVPQARAAKLPGYFGGSARSLTASAVSSVISVGFKSFAEAGCPCRGTGGVAVTKTTAAVSVAGVVTASATTASAFAQRMKGTATTVQTATVSGLNLLGGLITADVLTASAGVTADATKLTPSDTGTVMTNLVIAGTPVDAGVPDNTVIQLPGVGSVIVKQVVSRHHKNDDASETVNLLVVSVTDASNSLGLPVGATMTVGHAEASFNRQALTTTLSADARGMGANAEAGSALNDGAGDAGGVGFSTCAGTDGVTRTHAVSGVSVPGLMSAGTITTAVYGGAIGSGSGAQSSTVASNVSLLGGLITATTLAAAVQEVRTGAVTTASFPGATVSGLAIAGLPVSGVVAPNTTLTVPGVGYVVLNEQAASAHGVATSTGLRLVVTSENVLGLAVGAEVTVAEARAIVRPF